MGGARRVVACLQSTSGARHRPDPGSPAERDLQNRRGCPGDARVSCLRLPGPPRASSCAGSPGREAGGGEYHRRMKMTRLVSIAAFTLITAIPLGAQAPKDWLLRADRSASASDPDAPGAVKFSAQGSGFHAVTPQAAVFWNPANVATGSYTLKGTFTLVKPSDHTNYYGLVFGGSGLEGAQQTYLYFLVAQDGTWLLKQRAGDLRTNDIAKMRHSAVRTPG